MLSTFADIFGVISFVVSMVTFVTTRTILKNIKYQRTEYENERIDLQSSLMALRDNIVKDKVKLNLKYRSSIRIILFTYRQKYLALSSLTCLHHLSRAIRLCHSDCSSLKDRENLCISIDYLIARFNKQEAEQSEPSTDKGFN